jgi:thiol-disulfide isomerase/thioredoxin
MKTNQDRRRQPAAMRISRSLLPCLAVLGLFTAGTAGAQSALPADIDALTAAQFPAVLEANRGRVLIVNLWATWCAPCLREIPDLLALEQSRADDGLTLIGISLDDPDAEDEIRKFRDEWFPAFRTFHAIETDWYGLVGQLDPNWSSILPTSFIVDRDGRVVEVLTGGRDLDAFTAAVEPYL